MSGIGTVRLVGLPLILKTVTNGREAAPDLMEVLDLTTCSCFSSAILMYRQLSLSADVFLKFSSRIQWRVVVLQDLFISY